MACLKVMISLYDSNETFLKPLVEAVVLSHSKCPNDQLVQGIRSIFLSLSLLSLESSFDASCCRGGAGVSASSATLVAAAGRQRRRQATTSRQEEATRHRRHSKYDLVANNVGNGEGVRQTVPMLRVAW